VFVFLGCGGGKTKTLIRKTDARRFASLSLVLLNAHRSIVWAVADVVSHDHRETPTPTNDQAAASPAPPTATTDGAAAAGPPRPPAAVRVRFRLVRKVSFGERVAVVGAAPELGAWDVGAAPRLRWSEGHEWRGLVDFAAPSRVDNDNNNGSTAAAAGDDDDDDDNDDDDDDDFAAAARPPSEYKFVVVKDDGGTSASWEGGDNRVLDVAGLFPGPGMAVDVAVPEGGGAREAVASVVPLSALDGTPAARAPDPSSSSSSSKKKASSKDKDRRDDNGTKHRSQPSPQAVADRGPSPGGGAAGVGDGEGRVGVGAAGWLGKDVSFMQSNDHSRDRPAAATWDASHLPKGHPARALVQGDRDAPSWLEKLRVAQRVLVDAAPRQRPRLQALAHAYAYLQWVATGAVPCAEGGGHFRPNHHARAAQAVFRSLEWAIEEDAAEAGARARRQQAGGAALWEDEDEDDEASEGGEVGGGGGDGDLDDDARPLYAPRLRTLLARRLSTKLPSFGEQFTQTVPLTRIRDIAHRGDIPHDLKQEIKHTLQNKLHRNAGPEDLVAAEAMLARLDAAPAGTYSEPFLCEFRTFSAELREFFGAASLAQLLRDGVRPSLAGAATVTGAGSPVAAASADSDSDGDGAGGDRAGEQDDSVRALDHFLARKADLDAKAASAGLDDLVGVAHALVTVRAVLLGGLASGMRNDAPDGAAATRQRWRLAEARSEDYLFVLLSRVVGGMLAQGGGGGGGGGGDDQDGAAFLAAADALARGSDRAWAAPMGAAVLGLRSLALSGWQPAECAAAERELAAWQDAGGVAVDADGAARRLRATLDRAQRVCGAYTDAMLAVLPGAARRMGPALGVPAHAVATFAEAEVRASVAFQLSRLLALLQRAARVAAAAANGGAGLSEWEPIVAGTARGVLVDVPSLDCDAARRAIAAAGDKGVVLLLREATGDEELAVGVGSGGSGNGGAARPPLRGIALAQPLPHLSHLGVRARQERVPLATISPSALAREVLPFLGKAVELRVGADGSTVELALLPGGEADLAAAPPAAASSAKTALAAPAAAPPPDADRSKAREVVPLLDATAQTCGAKAASCARLLRLAAAAGAGTHGNGSAAAASAAAPPPPLFRAPRGAVLPFGAMEAAADAAGVRAQYVALLERTEALSAEAAAAVDDAAALARLDAACAELMRLVAASLRPSAEALAAVAAAFPAPGGRAGAPATPTHLIARSSANVEDLAGMSGAGLYDSVPNVPFALSLSSSAGGGGASSSPPPSAQLAADLGAAVAQVWASLHTRRAVLARRAAGVPQSSAAMAVLVQEQLSPDVAFVLHTRSPVELAAAAPGSGNGNGSNGSNGSNGHGSGVASPLALAELAPGLGETLAGASRGSGWRLLLDKAKGELASTLAFANFSEALVPPSSSAASSPAAGGVGAPSQHPEALYAKAGGRISGDVVLASAVALSRPAAAAASGGRTYALARRPVDYSRQRLSADAASRRELGAALARVSAALEAEFGGEAQDAEGCVVGFNALGSGGAPYQIYVVQSRPQP